VSDAKDAEEIRCLHCRVLVTTRYEPGVGTVWTHVSVGGVVIGDVCRATYAAPDFSASWEKAQALARKVGVAEETVMLYDCCGGVILPGDDIFGHVCSGRPGSGVVRDGG